MGAGLSRAQIDGRIRRRLQKIARDHGGTYDNGRKLGSAKFVSRAAGPDHLGFTAWFVIHRASNGEVWGELKVAVNALHERSVIFGGLGMTVAKALATYPLWPASDSLPADAYMREMKKEKP